MKYYNLLHIPTGVFFYININDVKDKEKNLSKEDWIYYIEKYKYIRMHLPTEEVPNPEEYANKNFSFGLETDPNVIKLLSEDEFEFIEVFLKDEQENK